MEGAELILLSLEVFHFPKESFSVFSSLEPFLTFTFSMFLLNGNGKTLALLFLVTKKLN